jgi:hypothetical protein
VKQAIFVAAGLLSLAILGVCQTPTDKGVSQKRSTRDSNLPNNASQKQQERPQNEFFSCNPQITVPVEKAVGSNEQAEIEAQRKLAKFTWYLVLVGIVQGVALVLTLFAIKHEAKIAANIARAANLNADAAMKAQRAWILIMRIGNPEFLYVPTNPAYVPGIVYEFKVIGHTPARIVGHGLRFHPVAKKPGDATEPDLPPIPDYGKPERNTEIPADGRLIAPDTSFTMRDDLESFRLTEEEFAALKKGDTIMCAYGYIEYRDGFERPAITRFCYVYDFRWGGVAKSPDGVVLNPPGFRLGGPAEYNKAT